MEKLPSVIFLVQPLSETYFTVIINLMKNYLKNNKLLAVSFLVLMVAAVFARTYNHHDWLYFKMDQARDANMVGNAVKNGPGELPLLGPRAGATDVSAGFLRLGPAFYYFQYTAGKIFNSVQPDVFAYPDLFFSILTIPLLYLFSRLYFSKTHSLCVAAMYALSFIVIQYSRFAWNPNSLLFFTLLAFYGLLKFLRTENFRKKIIFAAIAAIGIGIGSQLHFLGLFCLPAITFLVLVTHFEPWKKLRRKSAPDDPDWNLSAYSLKKNLAYAVSFLAVFLLIYSPVIISDVVRKGENVKNFLEATGTKPNDKDLSVKWERSLDKQTKYYCLVAFSECYKGKTEDNANFGFLIRALFVFGLGLAVRNMIVRKDKVSGDFLRLLLFWFGTFFVLAIPLYSSLRPRFFIPVFPIPFIFLGLIFVFAEEKLKKRGKYLALIITIIVIGLNTRGTVAWFREQSLSQAQSPDIDRTLILKNQDGVTLAQLEKAVDYIYQSNGAGTELNYYVKQEHFSPIKYLLSLKNDSALVASRVEKENYASDPYFAIIPSEKDAGYIAEEFGSVDILDSYQAGQIAVYKIKNINPGTKVEKISPNSEVPQAEAVKSDRVYCRDIFGSGEPDAKTEIDENGSDDLEGENADD